MAGAEPEESVTRPLLLQWWRHVTFLHWAYPPAVVQRLLPAGFHPHLHDGSAWVGLTPFRIEGSRLSAAPALRLSTFPETNLRTYAVGPDGLDAIWFLSLEAGSPAAVALARVTCGVPYRWADMAVDVGTDGRLDYRSRRRRPQPPVGHRIEVTPGPPIPDDELSEFDWFLTARWRALASVAGRRAYVVVEHPPWPLHRATVERIDQDLLAAAGLPAPAGETLVHYSPGVPVKLGIRFPDSLRR